MTTARGDYTVKPFGRSAAPIEVLLSERSEEARQIEAVDAEIVRHCSGALKLDAHRQLTIFAAESA